MPNKDLKEKAVQIKGKQYVQVKDRILFLSDNEDNYSIETDYEYIPERKMWIVKATLTILNNKYTGLAQEIESDDYKSVNCSSALENCETSAVGRACAMAGIGVIDSIASIDEINKANNRNKKKKAGTSNDLTCPFCGIVNKREIVKEGTAKTGKPYCLANCECGNSYFIDPKFFMDNEDFSKQDF